MARTLIPPPLFELTGRTLIPPPADPPVIRRLDFNDLEVVHTDDNLIVGTAPVLFADGWEIGIDTPGAHLAMPDGAIWAWPARSLISGNRLSPASINETLMHFGRLTFAAGSFVQQDMMIGLGVSESADLDTGSYVIAPMLDEQIALPRPRIDIDGSGAGAGGAGVAVGANPYYLEGTNTSRDALNRGRANIFGTTNDTTGAGELAATFTGDLWLVVVVVTAAAITANTPRFFADISAEVYP